MFAAIAQFFRAIFSVCAAAEEAGHALADVASAGRISASILKAEAIGLSDVATIEREHRIARLRASVEARTLTPVLPKPESN